MYTYIARQPIFDLTLDIVGYELLYRDGPHNAFPIQATSGVTEKIFVEQCLTYQNIILNNKLGFVNFDYDDIVNSLPFEFSKHQYIIEVLESCLPDDILYQSLKELHNEGYTIALDDFCIGHKEWEKFISLADILKVDIIQYPLESMSLHLRKFRKYDVTLLAEKVETYEQFNQAKALGFQYFQGYFFSKPEIIKTSKLDENFKANLDLLREVSKTDFSMNIVEKIIGSSATLSFRLLNYVNNQISIRSKIMSLKQAVNYLGKERIKRFASHGVMSMSVKNKPKTLFLCALYRADFICKLSRHISLTKISDKAYIVGILSLIDAMLDNDMSKILGEINLDREIELSLLRKEGMLGELILLVESIEQGDWNGIKRFSLNYSISKKEIMTTYLESVNHVNQENI